MKPPAHGGHEWTEETFSLVQLARRWHVPRRKVRRMLQHGELPFEEVHGQLRVPLAAVEKIERTEDVSRR